MSDQGKPWPERSEGGRFLTIFVLITSTWVTLGMMVTLLIFSGMAPAIPVLIFIFLGYGWIFNTLIRHWQSRQEELLLVLSTSVDAKLPLAPAIRAYLRDRPSGLYEWWVAIISHVIVFPLYYWIWHRHHSFDHGLARLVDRLEDGQTLTEALNAFPGLASQETMVAVAIGESTGQLAPALRQGEHETTTAAWLEITPRLIYPVFLLLAVASIGSFVMIQVMPRLQRIAFDFKQPLPATTSFLCESWDTFVYGTVALVVGFILASPLVAAFIAIPTLRWRIPLIGRFYRWEMQGLILRSLGNLLGLGRSIPEATTLLAQVHDLPNALKYRLSQLRQNVERGETLATALWDSRLLTSHMVPLVQVAERVHSLPWTLHELGDLRGAKAVRVARRLSMFIAPAAIIAIGGLVGFLCAAIFMPLLQWMEALSR